MKIGSRFYAIVRLACCAAVFLQAAPTALPDSIAASRVPPRIQPVAPPRAAPFNLHDVRLLDGPFQQGETIAVRYLLSLEPDRFLARFRQEAGLEPKAEHYPGWERQGVSGHSAGHYLSACAIAWASTGDRRFLERVHYMVAELDACQKAQKDGYVAAIPNGRRVYSEVAAGNIRSAGFDLNGCWVPNYTMHKLFAGLRDAYRLAGNSTALDIARKLADWFDRTLANLTEEQMQKVLVAEHGGLNETFADLYADTADERYLKLSRRFHHKAILDPLAQGEDILPGKHANTQIPKLIGLATRYELTGDAQDRTAAQFFWDRVVHHHSYVTGGHCDHESFGQPDRLNDRLSPATTETCNVYNMLKLTRHVFGWDPDACVADFYERALLNHIRSTQHPDGRVIYNLSLKPGHFKEYQPHRDAFTCCMGTGMENHVKYGECIYFHDASALWVNLYIASELRWKARGITLRQETAWPDSDTATFTITANAPQEFALRLRHPHWAASGLRIEVNGAAQPAASKPSSYAEIRRTWSSGDRIRVTFPMSLRSEPMPDNPNRIALFYGPTLLAAPLGPISDPAASQPGYVPVLLTEGRPVSQWVGPVSLEAQTFRTQNAGRPQDIDLVPFHRLHDRRYTVYLDRFTAADWTRREAEIRAEQERELQLAARTVDVLRVGEMQPERDHRLQGEKTSTGQFMDRTWRHATDGGWFSFVMKVDPARPNELLCTYWGEDAGNRTFDLLVDGKTVATQTLDRQRPGQFFDAAYPIPLDLTRGRQSVTVRLQAKPNQWAGGLFGARILRSEPPAASPSSSSAAAADLGRNRAPNPSFEDADNNRPQGWRVERWGGQGTGQHAAEGRTGARSILLSSTSGADISWSATVPVEPFGRYRLAGWIRTDQVKAADGRGALLNIHGLSPATTRAITGTADWTRVDIEFDIEDQDSIQVNCLLGGWGLASGRAWFDDIELVQLSQRPQAAPRITIDAAQVGQPLSPNIYSQFIEHLGRCIYGGIWAEMLEDRKFYFPITARFAPYRSLQNSAFPVVGASPWQIVGPAESVAMRTNQPFVGQHSPQVRSGAGLRQGGLGVTRDQSYAGYIWLKSDGAGQAAVELTLRWGETGSDRQTLRLAGLGPDYGRLPFEFQAGATTDRASLEIAVKEGVVRIGAVSIMPANHVDGMRADTLALLRELQAPIYRWPGGNFVSGYDWRDGVGDRDRRPPRTNPAWTGVEHNDFGIHEFIRFCRHLGTEPWITVNTGFGDAYSAAAQLEYCNGSADTYWGQKRASHGAVEPFRVKYWGVGNEMFGSWQLGYMQLPHYVIKQNWVVDKMREVDPNILCIASGNIGDWSAGLLKSCSTHMDFIAEHFYCQERPSLAAHVRQIPDQIRRKADWHRQARRDIPELKGRDIRIAMTEWNYWYGPHVFGELGTRYFLKDALGIAAGIHEFARQSDIVASAFYAQTVNVIGCIKTSRRNAAFETTGLVLKLYRQHFGQLPAATQVEGGVDAQAAWSPDRKTLTISVVNPSLASARIPLAIQGARLTGRGRRWQIAGADPMAFNDPDQPPRVVIEEQAVSGIADSLPVGPCSITLFALETR
ncbi:MAG TPA: glycoside hydrolase family 127 protein [Candidatus Paceibacterota bacterium]|nr:glycoside hydrolase family 127 protein [Verrucomicrobiota bacterium]HRZ44158.1 glycoside hydrolase family 127 protein [Candidatus Paceibacterota bacterium]